jgi:hypothetical protein
MRTFLLDRHPPVLLIVVMFGVFVAVLVGWSASCIARRGGPWRWSPVEAYGFVLLAVVGTFGWWWVNGPVEGRPAFVLSAGHGFAGGLPRGSCACRRRWGTGVAVLQVRQRHATCARRRRISSRRSAALIAGVSAGGAVASWSRRSRRWGDRRLPRVNV